MLHKHLEREREGEGEGGRVEGGGREKIKRERNVNKSINKKREGGERERDLLHPVMPYTRDSMVNDQIILIAKHSRQNE